MPIEIPDKFMGKPIKGAMKRALAGGGRMENGDKKPGLKGRFSLEILADCWRVSGVEYRDGIYRVDLSKNLLPVMTQAEAAEYREQAKQKNEFYTADLPLYHSLFTSLFRDKDSGFREQIEQIRVQIKNWLRTKYPLTLTRIRYKPQGKDEVIHNFGTSEKYSVQEDIAGANEQVKNSSTLQVYQALVGISNVQEIDSVYKWINETNVFLYRINGKPKKVDERVARLGAGSGWAFLVCDGRPQGSDASLGVRHVREAHARS